MNNFVSDWVDQPYILSELQDDAQPSSISLLAADLPPLNNNITELTWHNGHLSTLNHGQPRAVTRHGTWERPPSSGTLESIVDQAVLLPQRNEISKMYGIPCSGFNVQPAAPAVDVVTASSSATMTMDASHINTIVINNLEPSSQLVESFNIGTYGSARVGSCSIPAGGMVGHKVLPEWSTEPSVSTSATTFGTGTFITSTSRGSAENTSSEKHFTNSFTGDDHDPVSHCRPQRDTCDDGYNKKGKGKQSVLTKRSRAAAIHNQSERRRRDKINQKMKALQELVPNSNKTDKASLLDEVIEHLKQLKATLNMMNSQISMPPSMMLPMAMQQQLPVSMMAHHSMMAPMISMSMGMGHVMDLNCLTQSNSPQVIHPSVVAYMTPMPLRDAFGSSTERLPASVLASAPAPASIPTPASVMSDPFAALLSCSSQPMTLDNYSKILAFYQQQQQQVPMPTSNNP